MSAYSVCKVKRRTVITTYTTLIKDFSSICWSYPGTTADVVVDMCYLWQGSGHHLDATRAISNDGDVLTLSNESDGML